MGSTNMGTTALTPVTEYEWSGIVEEGIICEKVTQITHFGEFQKVKTSLLMTIDGQFLCLS